MFVRVIAFLGFVMLWSIVALCFSSGLVLLYSTVFPPADPYVIDQSFIDFTDVVIWPLTAVSLTLVLILHGNVFRHLPELIGRFSGLKAGDYEISFSSEGAKKLSEDLAADIQGYAVNAKREYDRHSEIKNIRTKLGICINALSEAYKCESSANGFKKGEWRTTIYIQDVVFSDALYQLTGYYPSGGGAGRRFSIRYGAIGLAWRSKKLEIWNGSTTVEDVAELVQKWGMHGQEAETAQSREIAICVPLISDQVTQAVVYIDAKNASSLLVDPICPDENTKFKNCVEKFFLGSNSINPDETVTALLKSISEVNTELAASNPRIKIYANS